MRSAVCRHHSLSQSLDLYYYNYLDWICLIPSDFFHFMNLSFTSTLPLQHQLLLFPIQHEHRQSLWLKKTPQAIETYCRYQRTRRKRLRKTGRGRARRQGDGCSETKQQQEPKHGWQQQHREQQLLRVWEFTIMVHLCARQYVFVCSCVEPSVNSWSASLSFSMLLLFYWAEMLQCVHFFAWSAALVWLSCQSGAGLW